MTTEPRRLSAPDVFVDNDVFCLRRDELSPLLELGGVARLFEQVPVLLAHQRALHCAAKQALSKLPGYTLWLLAGQTCWQKKSVVSQHRKLWGSLKASSLLIPPGHTVPESMTESDAGIRYFGALQLELGSVEAAAAIVAAEPVSHLVAINSAHDVLIADLVQRTWELPDVGPSVQVLRAVCQSQGVVFWPVGAFDDVEAGAVSFAIPSLIGQL